MKLSEELTTVTPFSKILALILFVTFPIIAFVIGINYQKKITDDLNSKPVAACTEEAKICSDGSSVGRTGPNCEFALCPTLAPTKGNNEEKICGGFAGIECPEGYECQLDKNYPDATGTCIDKTSSVKLYECPKSDYIDCMPGPDRLKSECNPQYLLWAQKNCPGFQGAAY